MTTTKMMGSSSSSRVLSSLAVLFVVHHLSPSCTTTTTTTTMMMMTTAFIVPQSSSPLSVISPSSTASSSTTGLFVKSRKARRMEEKEEKQAKGRSAQFYEAIEEAQGKASSKKSKKKSNKKPFDDDEEELRRSRQKDQERRQKMMDDAQRQMEQRPETSTVIVDDDTGFEIIQQGQSVLDVVTRKAVKLSDLGPEYRLAQMFPGVPPEIRQKYRFDNMQTMSVEDMVEQFKDVCYIKRDDDDGNRGLPDMPSVTNRAIDFLIANRDYLNEPFDKTLGTIVMRSAWKDGGDSPKTVELKALWRHYALLENHISAPFRQTIQDAEGRVGPNFGNLDLMSFCDGELYERVANYIVLKGMVAHWEKKVVDADYIEKTPQTEQSSIKILMRGDPRRYLPNAPILYTLKECTQVCAMAQTMCKQYVENEVLFKDFPPEVVFLEEALQIRGGTALRKYMIDEFCPARGITPEGLREGMRRLYCQLSNMQIDPYGDLTEKVLALFQAMAVGTDDEKIFLPYGPYLSEKARLDQNSPGYFQTYTWDYPTKSLVRFFDNQFPSASGVGLFSFEKDDVDDNEGADPMNALGSMLGIEQDKQLRKEPKPEKETTYTVPVERSVGRPHELDWFDKLNETPSNKVVRLGEVPSGRIIPDEECE
mmetsp:Transcript_8496/g.21203  ORF Transcript_8496/g.21203 Transcript_8496/m.21203 type:complete len:650 (+) Transcript_8496:193-2142(+)|eukprot:CAMPEP_0113452278 /NCGR_PEP_ID=MMETSP0014_2-20120614/6765_1 /TAXON_ID=2857 /ORGANISM="Nitzschia sp." /LENGTH=649 /DNA_ID=CAMNT_0000343647 /DNA_START=196 /DNA_END=2145 /DNA_ORIENTATION=- /assembly_acc=CAM_ASM_000159